MTYRGVIIAGLYVPNVKTAVFRFTHAVPLIDDTGGYSRFTLSMTDIEALDTDFSLFVEFQAKGFPQGIKAAFLACDLAAPRNDR